MTLLIFAGVALSHAITAVPISGIKASATLPDYGQNTFRPENMVMKKYVHPFYQVWGAKYNDKSITLEFLVEAQRLDQITLYNGFMRDSASYVNNSLAKSIKIYLNTSDNLVKVATLAKPKWHGYKISTPTSSFLTGLWNYHFVRCLEGSDTLEESTSESGESSESGENGITGESQE